MLNTLELIIFSSVTALLGLACSALIAPLLIKFLYKKKIVRHHEVDFSAIISGRDHKSGTPIMGGLLIIFAILMGVVIFYIYELFLRDILAIQVEFIPNIMDLLFVGISTGLMATLGGLDDLLNIFGVKRTLRTVEKQLRLAKIHRNILKRLYYWLTLPITAYKNIWYALGSYPGKGIHAGEKTIVQLIAGLILGVYVFMKSVGSFIWIPVLGQVNLGWLVILFIALVILSMSNAVNISDGMDGLAAGSMIPGFFVFIILAIVEHNVTVLLLDSLSLGALLTYLYFNVKPARIEMGDVGSLFLGTLFAAQAILLNKVILLPIVGFVFVAEVGSSAIQGVYRRLTGRRLFKMAPLHYHFQILGWSEEKVVMRFWIVSFVCALVGLLVGLVG